MGDFLGGGSGNQALIAGGLDIQTSTNIIAVPVAWGTNILSGNLTWADDFKYNNNDGGKGGAGKGSGAFYSASVMISIVRGRSNQLVQAFEGTSIHYNASIFGGTGWLSSVGGSYFTGDYPTQAPWSGWSGSYAYAALSYPSLSYLAIPNYNLGGSPTPPNFNYLFEFDPACWAPYSKSWRGGAARTYVHTGGDPGLIINDLFNGDLAAGRGFPGITLDTTTVLTTDAPDSTSDATLQTWCWAFGIEFSPVLRDAEKAGGIIDRWAQMLNCEIGWWDGTLKFIPRGDVAQTGNGLTYTPNLTIAFAFTQDDFITQDTDWPVMVNRKAPEDCFNVVYFEVTDQRNEWSPVPVKAFNENDIIASGGIIRIMPTVQAHEVTDKINVAPILAQLILQRQQFIRNTFTFKLGPVLGSLVTPMDLVSLTDPDTGLNAYVVRVTAVESDESDVVTVTAEDFPQGVATAPLYATQLNGSNPVNPNVDPGSINAPIIFEAPSTLASPAELIFVISGGFGDEANQNWGGCQIWGSTDGTTYAQIGQTANGPATQGLLTANIAAYGGANPDTTNTLSVDLNQSAGTLSTVPAASAQALATLCYVDGELLAYETAPLTSIDIDVQEIWSVPINPGPYTITVNNAANFISDNGVTYVGGGSPSYTVSAGVYTFTATDANASVDIAYKCSAPGYDLTTLYRGLYGTAAGAHVSGTQFGSLTGTAVVKIQIPANYIGRMVHFKFPSFNAYGNATEELSAVTAYTYAVTGAGYGTGTGGIPATPTGLVATAGNQSAVLAWGANSANDNVSDYLLYRAPGLSASFGSASLVWTGTALGYTDTGLDPNAPYTYFLVAQNAVGLSGNTAGVNLTTGAGSIPGAPLLPTTDALAAGNYVSIYSSGGVAKVRLADASLGQPASGFVLASASIGASVTVYIQGINTALSGLTPGDPYWLGTSGGVVVPPSYTSGHLLQPLGSAISATSMAFQSQGISTA